MKKQIYTSDNYIVVSEEDEEVYLYALKENECIGYALKLTVYTNEGKGKKGEYRGFYSKVWEENIKPIVINNFINKFLEDIEFRKIYLVEGEGFNEVIPYSDNGVNFKCKKCINTFYNAKTNNNFQDYIKLKTYGRDKFSKMKLKELEKVLDKETITKVKATFDEEKSVVLTLRWCCRGLLVEDAIRKIKTDLEIASNMMSKQE